MFSLFILIQKCRSRAHTNMRLYLGNPLTFTASYTLLSLNWLILLLPLQMSLPSSFIIFIVVVISIAISISCYSIILHISFWWFPSLSQCRTWGCHCLSKSTIVCSFHQNIILTILIISTNLSVFNKVTPMIINPQGPNIREYRNRRRTNIFGPFSPSNSIYNWSVFTQNKPRHKVTKLG